MCNAWRAIAADPDAVAGWASGPLNETDLFARHLWLVNDGRSRLLHGLEADPEFWTQADGYAVVDARSGGRCECNGIDKPGCGRRAEIHRAASDVRVGWPACVRFEKDAD